MIFVVIYGVLFLAVVSLSAFAVLHAFRYSYLSSRTRALTYIYLAVATVLLSISLYFFFRAVWL